MNNRTPAEQFRATLAALSREQLIEAMRYLRGYNSFAMDRALELVTMPVGAAPPVPPHFHAFIAEEGGACACGLRFADWCKAQDDAELDHMATEGTRS